MRVRANDSGTTVLTVAEGVARVSWTADESVSVVSHQVAAALATHHRVEALIDPDDERGQRTATWSGLRREGIMRGVTVDGVPVDRIVYARVVTDVPADEPEGFRALLNSFLPRKRAIGQFLIRDDEDRVLLCQLTYKPDWDLPGGVVEVGESPAAGVSREVQEELELDLKAGPLLLIDWLPPWSGWDDALTLVYDGGVHDQSLIDAMVREEREIRSVEFCTMEQVRERCADFTARRVESALASLHGTGGVYTESGRAVG
jgi:ADP-ribose pyrophosphatase YjhB (NUDIX family)